MLDAMVVGARSLVLEAGLHEAPHVADSGISIDRWMETVDISWMERDGTMVPCADDESISAITKMKSIALPRSWSHCIIKCFAFRRFLISS